MHYQTSPGLRWSDLRVLATASPLALRHHLDTAHADTTAYRLGRAIHLAVLQPDVYAASLTVAPPELTTASGALSASRAAVAWLAEVPPSATVLAAGEAAEIDAIAAAVAAHPAASALLATPDLVAEEPIHWDEHVWLGGGLDEVVIACKARPDLASAGGTDTGGVVVDLKSTATRADHPLSIGGLSATMARLAYHGQLAWYARGLAAVGRPVARRVIVWAQKSAPYDVVCTTLAEGACEIGDALAEQCLCAYATCVARGEWPGVAAADVTLDLPRWAYGGDGDDGTDYDWEV